MKVVFSLLLSLAAFTSWCANENLVAGARSAAMSHASLTLTDHWSVFHNQGALGFVDKTSAGIAYENRFFVQELGLKAGTFVLPTGSGTFGFSAASFGFSAYNENKFGLAYGRKFGENLSIGVQLDYLSQRFQNEAYGSKGTVAAEIGVVAKLSPQLSLGAHVYNLGRAKIADYNDERLPTILRAGLRYDFTDKVLATVETEKDILTPARFKAGIEYHIVEMLHLRTGVSSGLYVMSFGFGLNFNKFQLDFASTLHSTLGMTPQVAVSYDIK